MHLVTMDLQPGQGCIWEGIVELARLIDHGVASRQGIDTAQVVRLSQAVIAFQSRLTSGSVRAPDQPEPATEAEKT